MTVAPQTSFLLPAALPAVPAHGSRMALSRSAARPGRGALVNVSESEPVIQKKGVAQPGGANSPDINGTTRIVSRKDISSSALDSWCRIFGHCQWVNVNVLQPGDTGEPGSFHHFLAEPLCHLALLLFWIFLLAQCCAMTLTPKLGQITQYPFSVGRLPIELTEGVLLTALIAASEGSPGWRCPGRE